MIVSNTSTITGHLRMLKSVTASLPIPISSPTARAIGPVITIPIATSVISSTTSRVIATCSGRSFQNGRPSLTS